MDTPRRPDGPGMTWADVRAHADACLWFDCRHDLGPDPDFVRVREWYARRPVVQVQALSAEDARARGKGLAALMCAVCGIGAGLLVAAGWLWSVLAR